MIICFARFFHHKKLISHQWFVYRFDRFCFSFVSRLFIEFNTHSVPKKQHWISLLKEVVVEQENYEKQPKKKRDIYEQLKVHIAFCIDFQTLFRRSCECELFSPKMVEKFFLWKIETNFTNEKWIMQRKTTYGCDEKCSTRTDE